MKLLICAHLGIGDIGVTSMPSPILQQWQKDKIRALDQALEIAASHEVRKVILVGGLFAEGFIPQSLLEATCSSLASTDIDIVWLAYPREVPDIEARVELPAHLHLIRDAYTIAQGPIQLSIDDESVFLEQGTGRDIQLVELKPMEPLGFGSDAASSMYLVEYEEEGPAHIEALSKPIHPFITRDLDASRAHTTKDMLSLVQNSIEGLDPASCLRLVFRGPISLYTYLHTGKLEEVLSNRFFYAEVANECTIDLEEGELDCDVSLLAEFVRMVASDDSLSTVEKTKIMRCGWNALNGKELAE